MGQGAFIVPRVRDGGVTQPRGEVMIGAAAGTTIVDLFANEAQTGGADEDPALSYHQSERGILAHVTPGLPAAGFGIYSWINREISVLNSPNWQADFTVTLQRDFGASDFGRHTGMYLVVGKSGKRYVVGVANSTTSGNLILVRLDLETRLWSQTEIATGLGGAMDGLHACIAYHGLLWCSSANQVVGIDVEDPTLFYASMTAGAVTGTATLSRLVVAHDRLFLVLQRTTFIEIWESVGTTFVQLALPATMPDAVGNSRFTVLSLTGAIQIVYTAANGPNNGIRHFAFSMNSDTKLDVGSGGEFTGITVPPADSQGTPGAGWPNETLRWSYFEIGVGVRSDTFTSCQVLNDSAWSGFLSLISFRCNSPPEALTADVFAAGGLGANWTQITANPFPVTTPPLPQNVVYPGGNLWGTSEHCAFPGDHSVAQLLSATQIPGENRFRLKFWIAGEVTTTGLHMAFFYTDPSGASGDLVSLSRCTLIGPVVGVDQFATPAVLSGNKVIDCTSENNSNMVNPPTIYEITWDADADGFPLERWGRIMATPIPTFIP